MTTNAYIKLGWGSGGSSVEKKFRVMFGSYKPTIVRPQSLVRALTGVANLQVARMYWRWELTVRVANITTGTDPGGSDYGVLADLLTAIELVNPNANPSNLVRFTDNLGTAYTDCYLIGDVGLTQLTPLLDGANGFFMVPLLIEQKSVL